MSGGISLPDFESDIAGVGKAAEEAVDGRRVLNVCYNLIDCYGLAEYRKGKCY